MSDKYILEGKVAIPTDDTIAWTTNFEDSDNRRVDRTELENGIVVSTVFLGLNHNFGDGPPLLFETMVFPSKTDGSEIDCERYSTWEEAESGHQRMVETHK